jgi:peptide/bleomycin uptake transporter
MFASFFPRPRLFGLSAILWGALAVLLWNFGARDWGAFIGLPQPSTTQAPVVGILVFCSAPFLWFYLYYWRPSGCSHCSGASTRRIPGPAGRSGARP